MKNQYLRKIILAGAVVILAIIYIIQSAVSSRSNEKIFKIEKPFDTILISSEENGNLELKRDGNFWKIDGKDVDENRAERLNNAVKEIKTLGIVAKSSDESSIERYGFTDSQKITVKVSGEGNELLSLEIGKDAAGGQQNYVKLGGKSEIYLASGALKSTFNVKKDEIVKKPEEKAETSEPPAENEPVSAESEAK